jgi:hypothetical protein
LVSEPDTPPSQEESDGDFMMGKKGECYNHETE